MRFILLTFLFFITHFLTAQNYGLDWVLSARDTTYYEGGTKQINHETDSLGNTYVLGTFGRNIDLDPSNNQEILHANADGFSCYYLAKYNSTGQLLWAKDFGGGHGVIKDFELDSGGNVYAIGSTIHRFHYDPAYQDATFESEINAYPYVARGFIVRYTSNGDFDWIKPLETEARINPNDIEISSSGRLVVTGTFEGQCFFSNTNDYDTISSNGMQDVFISRFTQNGEYVNSLSFGGVEDDRGLGISVDDSENVYLIARLEDSVDLDPSSNTFEVYRNTNNVSYYDKSNTVVKYDSAFSFEWGHLFSNGYSRLDIYDIDVNSLGQIAITGEYDNYQNDLIDFDFGLGTSTINLPHVSGGFIAVYDSSSTFLWKENLGVSYFGNELIYDNSNNVYVVGEIYDSFNELDNGFIHKYNQSGTELFSKVIVAGDNVYDFDISLNHIQEPILIGTCEDSVDLDPSVNNYYVNTHSLVNPPFNIFYANYSVQGGFLYGFTIVDREHYASQYNDLTDNAVQMETDDEGNIVTLGTFQGPTDFDPSTSSELLGNYGTKGFLVKYDSLGNYKWGFEIDSTDNTNIPFGGVSIDSQNNTYICVTAHGETDLDPSAANAVYTPAEDYVNLGLVAKYDTSGNHLWSFEIERISNTGSIRMRDIVVDSSGNVIVVGFLIGNYIYDFDPTSNQYILSSTSENAFIAKYDPSGNLIWAVSFDAFEHESCDLAVNSNDEFFVTGSYRYDLDIDPSSSSYILNGPWWGKKIFLAKYDASANLQWGFYIGNSDLNYGTQVVAGNDHVYLSGAFSETCDMDPGPNTFNLTSVYSTSTFLARFKSINGDFDWAIDHQNAHSRPRGMDINSNEDILIHGTMKTVNYPIDVDPSPDTLALEATTNPHNANYYSGQYTVVHDSLGNLKWSFSMPSSTIFQEPYQGSDVAQFDHLDNIIISGGFACDGDFAPREAQHNLDAFNGTDFFIAKYSECSPKYSTESESVCGSINWHNHTYNSTGSYSDTISSAVGCDSIVTLDLTVFPIDTTTETVNSCNSYTWNNSTYNSSGVYYNYLTNNVGCDSIEVLNLTIDNADTTLNLLGDTTLVSNQNGAIYQWYDCNNSQTISGQQSQSYTPDTFGNYAAIVEFGSCIDTTDCITINPSSLNEDISTKGINIYPNPTYGDVFVDLIRTNSSVQVKIIDLTGRELYGNSFNDTSKIKLNLSYPPGTYLLYLKNDTKEYQFKIIKNY